MALRPAGSPSPSRRKPSVVRLILLVAVAVIAGAWVWDQGIKDHVIPRNFGVVAEGKVYRSGRLTPATMRKTHAEHPFKTIVDLGAWHEGSAQERVEARTAAALGVERHVFRLEGDGRGNPNAYVAALRIMMDPASQPVLVHCSAGSERTSAAAMLYRSLAEGQTIDDQIEEARAHKHDPGGNPHMLAYLADWRAKIEAAVRGGGWVEGFEPPVDEAAADGVLVPRRDH